MEQESIFKSNRIKNAVLAFLIVATVFGAVQAVRAMKLMNYTPGLTEQKPQIVVTGTGEAVAIPDLATITFSVTEEGKTPKDAQGKVTERMNKALAYLKTQGIAEKDIKTVGYYSNPKYEWQQIQCVRYPCPSGKSILLGYELSHTVQVKVRNTDKAGDILGGLGGLNVQNLSGISFSIEDESVILNEARSKAIAEAKSKADVLAKQLGVKIVRIISFSENRGGYPVMYEASMSKDMMGMGGDNPAPQVPSGENKYTSNVIITFEIR